MAEKKGDVESLLSRARHLEKEYDWLGAADSYGGALESLPKEDFIGIGRVQEATAFALFRAAMQSENIEEFKDRLSDSEKQYEKAKQSYVKAGSIASSPLTTRCEAMLAYLGFWKAQDVATRSKKIVDSWSFARRAMDAFGQNEVLELAKTYNELFPSVFISVGLSDDPKVRSTILNEAADCGGKIVGALAAADDRDELVRALVNTAESLVALNAWSTVSSDELDRNLEKAAECWCKALQLSEKTALVAKANADHAVGLGYILWKDFEQIAKRQLECVRNTRDRLAIGTTFQMLAFCYYWKSGGEEDPEDINALLDMSLRYVEEARREFDKIAFVPPPYYEIWSLSPRQAIFLREKYLLETDSQRRRELTKELLDAARLELEAAEKSGYPIVVCSSRYSLNLILVESTKMESNKAAKSRLLDEAIDHVKEALRLEDLLEPGDFWSRGMLRARLGATELQYAEITDNVESKKAGLQSSILHMNEGLNLLAIRTSSYSSAGLLDEVTFTVLSRKWRDYGSALGSSYAFTGNRETLADSAMAFEKAADFDGKAGLPSHVAESLWEAARTYDDMGDHLTASTRFVDASHHYRDAADKIPRLRELFEDQILYMKAWSEIEKAKFHHSRQDSASSKEHYKTAAELHASSRRWSYLSANYLAWAEIENAEELSQNDRSKDSIESFRRAVGLIKDSEETMREHSDALDSPEEKQLVHRLIDAIGQRQAFCEARIALEEARLLDMAGNLDSASERYGLVSEQFTRIEQGLESKKDKKETQLIITLSKAWKAMARAEAESSPDLYEEAARLFIEAKDLSPGEKAKALAMGHSRLSTALAAGARYADTGDSALHKTAVQNLESAAKYYLKAGQQTAVEYVKGSKLLFDGYDYMNRASNEQDEQKKTKLYSIAEKVLQASVSSFEKAGQQGRKEQVLKILAKVRDDRELALSLVDVFVAPDMVQTTRAFTSPGPTVETAAGLDRFEHAEIRATLIAKPKNLHVGEELSLEIELVNAGRGPAQLTKVEATVPEGFVVVQEPEKYRMEDSQINLRGRRLDALKTEDVRIVLKPTAKGSFTLKPVIRYLDDSGANRTCEPVPVEVTVREMGISGWLRGT